MRDLAVLAVVALVLWAIYLARSVTAPIIVGAALAYVFNPLVAWAGRRLKMPRWASAAVIIALVVLLIGSLLLWTVPRLAQQVDQLARALPSYLKVVGTTLGIDINWQSLPEHLREAVKDKIENRPEHAGVGDAVFTIKEYAGPVAAVIKYVYAFAIALIGSLVALLAYLPITAVIIGFCFFFFTCYWASIIGWFDPFIPPSSRDKTLDVLGKMDRTVSAFVRGRLIQSLVMGLVLSVGWWIADVPYWLLLGMGCGLLNLVPFLAVIGWIAALVLTSVDHLSSNAQSYADAITAAQAAGLDAKSIAKEGFRFTVLILPTVVYLIAQGLDGWVIEPIVQGKATNLDPLTVLLSVLIGATLAGLLGMVLAIPAAACIKILGQEVIVPRLRRFAQEKP